MRVVDNSQWLQNSWLTILCIYSCSPPDYYRTDGKPYTYANFCPGAHPGGATGSWTTGSNDRATITPYSWNGQSCWDDIWASFGSFTRAGCMYDPNANSGSSVQETPTLDTSQLNFLSLNMGGNLLFQ